jgi:hypothetical protein
MHIHLDKKLTVSILATTAVVSVFWHAPELAMHVAKEHFLPHSSTERVAHAAAKPDSSKFGEYNVAPLDYGNYDVGPAKKNNATKVIRDSYNPGYYVTESYNPGYYEEYTSSMPAKAKSPSAR